MNNNHTGKQGAAGTCKIVREPASEQIERLEAEGKALRNRLSQLATEKREDELLIKSQNTLEKALRGEIDRLEKKVNRQEKKIKRIDGGENERLKNKFGQLIAIIKVAACPNSFCSEKERCQWCLEKDKALEWRRLKRKL